MRRLAQAPRGWIAAAGAALLAAGVAVALVVGGTEPETPRPNPPPAPPPSTGPATPTTPTTPRAAQPGVPERPPPPASEDQGGDVPSARPQPGAADGLVVGIGEQLTAMFSDPRFRELGVDKARLVTAWDTTSVRFEREIVDTWLAEARRAGVEPFITFGHSRVNPEKLPSVAEFRAAFRAFRKRYPGVRIYAPWNEINHASQPTHDDPRRAAQYYNVVRAECRGCTVLAGDVLDQEGMTRYLAEYRRHLDGPPRIWGLHNYSDTNRFRSRGLRALLDAVPGDVWLTETGGIVRFGSSFPQSERRAARALNYMLGLARRTDRVKRLYVYNWTGAEPADRFDAGLLGPDGSTRRGYDVLRAALRG